MHMSSGEIIMAMVALCNLALVAMAWGRTRHRDTAASAEGAEALRADLKYLTRGIDEIRVDLRAINAQLSDFDRRLTVVEQSAKQAHHRLDEVVGGHPVPREM